MEILTRIQKDFLAAAGAIDYIKGRFYLTGGTALAGFYLFHRYSEDLDFFTEQDIDFLNLNAAIDALKKNTHARSVDFEQSYNRNLVFFHFDGAVLKTEFTFFPFPRMEKAKKQFGLNIDSLLDIAVNKLFTIYQRSAARDYIDLYCICKESHLTIADLVKKAKAKFDWHIDPLQMGAQFVKAADAEDYPKMITNVSPEEWRGFFWNEAKKLKSDILK